MAPAWASRNVERHFVFLGAPLGSYLLALYLPLFYLKLWCALRGQAFDVVHSAHLMLVPLAILWAKTHGAKSVYDAYEFHAVDLPKMTRHRPPVLPRILEFVENRLVSWVDGVLTIDSMNGALERRYRMYNGNVAVLSNVPSLELELEEGSDHEQHAPPTSDQSVVYVGGLSRIKGSVAAVEAINLVREEIPEVKLTMIGSFRDKSERECRQYVRQNHLEENVEFIDWMPYADMFCHLRRARLGLAPYQPTPKLWMVSRGNERKFFTYMQASLPIVGPAFGEAGNVVREEGCGILCDTTNPDEIAKAIVYLLQHPEEAQAMGRRGRAAIEQKYNMSIEEKKLLGVYNRLGVKPRESE